MKLSCRWLKKFVDFQGDPQSLAHRLTMAGLEVEALEKVRHGNGEEDVVLEIGLTPNRGDCLSIHGLAREVAALTGNPLKEPTVELVESGNPVEDFASVTLEEPGMCPRYLARVITDVKIGPSPQWMVDLLRSVGQRSINNIVDVTNYVMFEWGHPLHAFDYDLLHEKRIVVRRAGRGESFETIDRTQCRLHEAVLVIADGKRAVALAGIMGGLNSEVGGGTQTILLECAYFDPSAVRKTAKEYKVHSESSHRFERGTDPNRLDRVIDYAAFLIAQVSGGKVARGRMDRYPVPIQRTEVDLRTDRVNKILGAGLRADEIQAFLERLSFEVSRADNGTLRVSVPTFRPDITREIDLIEEVARLNGYNNIRASLPSCGILESQPPDLVRLDQQIKNILTGIGFQEIITYSFINKEHLNHLRLPAEADDQNYVPIINPISQEQNVLRTTLVPGMLETLARNMNSGISDLMLFETGRVFHHQGPDILPEESLHLVAAVTERVDADIWKPMNTARDFYSIKGFLQALWARLHAEPLEIREKDYPWFVSGKSVRLGVDGEKIGTMGEAHPRVLDAFKIDQRVFFFEISVEALLESLLPVASFEPLPRFPSSLRDLSIVVEKKVKAEEIAASIRSVGGDILQKVAIFDQFQGGNLPESQKSLTYSLVFRSETRTLTDKEVDELQQKILDFLAKRFSAHLR